MLSRFSNSVNSEHFIECKYSLTIVLTQRSLANYNFYYEIFNNKMIKKH